MRSIFFLLVISILFFQCTPDSDKSVMENNGASKVELKNENGNYQLYINNKPFWINGAGLEYGSIEKLAEHGGNSFRTWNTNNGQEILDRAQKNGLYVTMGVGITSERHGFDYSDEKAVAKQFERIKSEVLQYKDHPALIIWVVGNELNLNTTNPAVWDAVNQISKYIHEVDPNHLTTTTVAGIDKQLADEIKKRADDIDLLSIQMYADIINLPKRIKDAGWEKAYMVTEWGATGHWEMAKTAWDVPIENNSSIKANLYLERFKKAIEPYKNQCVGSYVFLWGQKQERTPTWYGMFLETGEETESIDVMHYIWKNEWPSNRTPQIDSFLLDGKTAYENVFLEPGKTYQATTFISDLNGDPLNYLWDIKFESTDLGEGGDHESVPESLEGLISGNEQVINLQAPSQPGAYRLFFYAFDGNNHAAHANIPFYVKGKSMSLNN